VAGCGCGNYNTNLSDKVCFVAFDVDSNEVAKKNAVFATGNE